MDIKLDDVTHDALFVNGPMTKAQTTQPYVETVAQRLKIRLLTFLGEWIINTAYGVPWWQSILGKKQPKERVDLILQQQILLEEGVKELVSFTSILSSNRQYSATFRVKVRTGEVTEPITITPSI